MSNPAITSPVEPSDVTPQDLSSFTPPDQLIVSHGRELRSNKGFSKSIDGIEAKKTAPQKEEKTVETKESAPEKSSEKSADPIAAKNAEAAKEKSEDKKSDLDKRFQALLKEDDEEPAKEPEAKKDAKAKPETAKKTEKADKAEPDDEEKPVSDEEIEAELKTPKTERSDRRFRELHRRWKAAEAQKAETAKQIKERDDKLVGLEKQMKEQSAKIAAPDPDLEKKLEELQMYKREKEIESSDHVKSTFGSRINRNEEAIYTVLQNAGIKFEGLDAKKSSEKIKELGGFRALARSNPDLAEGILERLNVADRKEVEASMMSQTLLEQERKNYIETERGKAKEYFEKQAKEEAESKASKPDPRVEQEHKKKAIETLKSDLYGRMELFKEEEIPSDASVDERKRLSQANSFSSELREKFAVHIDPKTDDDFIHTAMAATLAHKLKRESSELKRENKRLREENERIKNGSKTSARSGAIPMSSESNSERPATSFTESLDRALQRRGSA